MALDPRTLAPLVSLGVTMVVRKGLQRGYERRTGNTPPDRGDLGTPLGTVILWAGLTAVTTALIDVLVQRGAARLYAVEEAKAEQRA
jgi:hypothetical protein